MRSQLLISIITVCLNSEKHIRQTIESVLKQTYSNIEYIIIDGLSTDSTIDIIKEYEPLFCGRMHWISEKDSGIYDAINKGLKMSNGELIGIINSDDWYDKDAVLSNVNEYVKNPEVGVFYGNLYAVSKDGSMCLSVPVKDLNNYSCNQWMPFGHPTAFVQKRVYDQFGGFNTKYKIAADHEFIMRCSNNGIKFKYINKAMSYFREGGMCEDHAKALRESTLIKIEYGAKPVRAWLQYYITVPKVSLYKRYKKNKIFWGLYNLYKNLK